MGIIFLWKLYIKNIYRHILNLQTYDKSSRLWFIFLVESNFFQKILPQLRTKTDTIFLFFFFSLPVFQFKLYLLWQCGGSTFFFFLNPAGEQFVSLSCTYKEIIWKCNVCVNYMKLLVKNGSKFEWWDVHGNLIAAVPNIRCVDIQYVHIDSSKADFQQTRK